MTETIPTEVTYSTFEEFTDNTRVAAQAAMAEDDWTPHALHAEYLIDSYVNCVKNMIQTNTGFSQPSTE